ncbi:hypothetical protein N0V93_002140 [Gnomoniopsis smithogilvyi]|uniref:Uncharacterized protein n=1 Tax=Gnomoniopsis smithogilvyi TaxID=1191159 RepID=A0A9W9CXV6_9PEZI|nr:hypothetical protein N0V93_002140 [Gnomoniopsis smithogilvyi]
MAPTKTPGGQEPSEKFLKRDAAAKGLGADNAPAHTEPSAPGTAPVASDSGIKGNEGTVQEAVEGASFNEENLPGMEGIKGARPGGAAKGPNLAGPQ